MIPTAISWYFKQRHVELWRLAMDAENQQRELLDYFTRILSRTEYGEKYQIKAGDLYEGFSQKLPIIGYEELTPFIKRSMDGEIGLIWPSEITWFAKSSGTTSNESKFIPITYEAMEYTHFKGSKEPLTQHFHFNPNSRLFEGKGLLIGGSNTISQTNENVFVGDLSAVLMAHLPSWANWKSTPDIEIATLPNWEEKLERMAQATKDENVTSISGAPTWTMVLIQRILEITKADNIHEVWPNLELFIHGGMSFEPYKSIFQKLAPSPQMRYIETYNASEGFFGVQAYEHQPEMLLTTHHGVFYEFYPVTKGPDFTIPLWEVETGIQYAVVVTNNSGLWRYAIGDTIVFTQTPDANYDVPYLFRFSGRTKLFINAFGEELIMENAETAVSYVSEKLNLELVDYTAAPCFDKGQEGHEWIFEFKVPPSDVNQFRDELDLALKSVNSDYEGKRVGDLLMKPPKVIIAPNLTFHNWLKMKGKLGGQNKVPRLRNDRQIIEEVLSLL